MPKFERISEPILDHKGNTIQTDIRLSNNSHIEIDEGDRGRHFRLKFAMDGGGGWWVDKRALGELIAELLYIRREVVEKFGEEDEADQPIEVHHPKIQWKFADVKVPIPGDDLA